ncbi:MAG: hypothetical protein OXH90_09100 [Paracoccaceae bacterium]|nr:hypothetical protein [Paracoccaceae bacterium]MDE2917849.1 hypothetical protein [Paracoccaceae bacterium]
MTILPIDVVIPRPSNFIRTENHPVLVSGNKAYPKGRYILEFNQLNTQDSLHLHHQIIEAPLVTNLVNKGKAKFGCIVSSPMSSYRKIHLSSNPQQTVNWDVNDLGEPPMFTPMVICTIPTKITLDTNKHGVHKIWHGETVSLQKGDRLVIGDIIHLETSITHLLSLHEDKELKQGQFRVEPKTEPFQFIVKLHPELHQFLKINRSDVLRHNIIVNIVTACFALLQRDYREENDENDWKSHSNLKALANFLEGKKLPHWVEENFNPEEVATNIYPLYLHKEDGETE